MQLKSPTTDYEGGLLSGRRTITATFDGQGSAITAGAKARCVIPLGFVPTGWTVVADVSGSIVVDVKKATYSGFPTTSSVAGTEKPTLSSAQKNQDTSLSTWSTLSAGDVVEFVVDSASTVTQVTVVVEGRAA